MRQSGLPEPAAECLFTLKKEALQRENLLESGRDFVVTQQRL